MRFVRPLRRLLLLALLAVVVQAIWAFGRSRPQDVPWGALDLRAPVGLFTGAKLARLGGEPVQCRALLARAEIAYTALPRRRDGERCGYDDGIRLTGPPAFRPAGLGTACPVAAALAVWRREVVEPAALLVYGRRVVAIDHFGSYSCRRLYGRSEGDWSEHARANAVDIAGFRLADGRRITVARDWTGPDGVFLRRVRDGACTLFATTLSPDYNAAHRDHLHLDQAARGGFGGRVCR